MAKKVGPNEPCPCGSGRNSRSAAGPAQRWRRAASPYTQSDRASAFAKLDFFIDELWAEEEEAAFAEFWGRHADREGELSREFLDMSRDVQLAWFAFDYQVEGGARVVDEFLRQAVLTAGERSYLMAIANRR